MNCFTLKGELENRYLREHDISYHAASYLPAVLGCHFVIDRRNEPP
jgi:hypothetical protein